MKDQDEITMKVWNDSCAQELKTKVSTYEPGAAFPDTMREVMRCINVRGSSERTRGQGLSADGERDEMVDRTTTLWKGCETALE